MENIPDYLEGFPNMTEDGWASNANSQFNLGWIDGLFKVAIKSIDQLFGDYELHLNEDDLLDMDVLNDFAGDGTSAIIYASVWLLAGAIFTIAGIIWCLCNKCICCCRSSFKGRGDDEMGKLQNTDPRFEPRYSQRKGKKFGKPSPVAIVVAVLMAIWLLSLLLMTLHTFGANEKTNKVIEEIEPDLNSALNDIENYLGYTLGQLNFTLGEAYGKFSGKVNEILDACTVCVDPIRESVITTLHNTSTTLTSTLEDLNEAVENVRSSSREAKEKIDEQLEDNLTKVNDGLYWIFLLFNILYVAVFGLVLFGTVLAVFAKQSGLKTAGYLLMRVAIVLMFIFGIFVVLQLVLMFALGGIMTEVFCPAIKRLEEAPMDTTPSTMVESEAVRLFQDGEESNYTVPSFGRIIRGCKNNIAAYETFELKGAVDIDVVIDEIKESFESIREIIPASATGNGLITHDELGVNADLFQQEELKATLTAILDQMGNYTEFIRTAVKEEVGKCKPAYNAMNATINLFCNKVASPVIAYWWILQFVAVVFLLIIVTAMVFERLHF